MRPQEGNFSKSRGNAEAVGWVKRSGPTTLSLHDALPISVLESLISRGNAEAVGWVKRSGPTTIPGIGGSVATLLDLSYETAAGY